VTVAKPNVLEDWQNEVDNKYSRLYLTESASTPHYTKRSTW